MVVTVAPSNLLISVAVAVIAVPPKFKEFPINAPLELISPEAVILPEDNSRSPEDIVTSPEVNVVGFLR